MSGAEIAAEVSSALLEAAQDVGDGQFEVTLLRSAGGAETPWEADAPTVTETAFRAMASPYSQGQIDGTMIRAGDIRVMIEVGAVVPSTGDSLRIEAGPFAGTWKVERVDPYAPLGVTIYHRLQCRK